jgi:hypothetical protein
MYRQIPPNAGTPVAIGSLGVNTLDADNGFDIRVMSALLLY